jgi:hypothetical protein
MHRVTQETQSELRVARQLWSKLPEICVKQLVELLQRHRFSVKQADVQLLNGRWYVTHAGLIRLAHSCRCAGIRTSLERKLSDASRQSWIFRAVVFRSRRSRGFAGYDDADPSNVSTSLQGAEMRIAETRAVNRALRKALVRPSAVLAGVDHTYSCWEGSLPVLDEEI